MNNILTRRNLSQLAATNGAPLVSLYMPMHTGAEHRQNPIRFKNLTRQVEEKLLQRGLSTREVRDLLGPAHELVNSDDVWRDQGRSLAVFAGSESLRVLRPTVTCRELCNVGNSFYVIPLVEWLHSEHPYYVLAVSQNEVRLLHGTRSNIEAVDVPGMPENKQDALRIDETYPGLQAHSGRPYLGRSKEGAVFHGHGGAPDAAKPLILSYFQEIDRALANRLRQEAEPLIFAGVDYLFPIYQEANTYPHLAEQPVTGNPEVWSPDDIRERAWPLVAAMLRKRHAEELEKHGNFTSAGRTAKRLDEILLAAHAGAVETLFVDRAAQATGAFNVQDLAVEVDEQPQEDSENLINLAAVLTLRNSGMVEMLEAGQVPGGGAMAATLRYPLPAREQRATAGSR